MSYAHGTMFVAKCASESDRMHTHHTAAIKKTSPNHHHTADIKKTTSTNIAGRRPILDARSIIAYVAKNIPYPN